MCGSFKRHGNSTKEPKGNSRHGGKKIVKSEMYQVNLTGNYTTKERMGEVKLQREKKRIKTNEQNLNDLWSKIESSNTHVTGVPESKER